MSLASQFLPEFDEEMASTRRVLERLPDDKVNWKAHPRSNSIGWVAGHMSEIPGWTIDIINRDEMDAADEDQPRPDQTRQFYLELFDKNVHNAREALLNTDDAHLKQPWTFYWQKQEVFRMPRIDVLRKWVLRHIIHHRGHMCVYYRLNDIPVPGMYGPSADDAGV
ncbi:MAG: DinB family protein [Rubinisphaera brasiliensis]|uniref:DinB family protein n=1 Tax=Rubinisphaera brasiliensis TaxID=119 RepID=UPI0039188866